MKKYELYIEYEFKGKKVWVYRATDTMARLQVFLTKIEQKWGKRLNTWHKPLN